MIVVLTSEYHFIGGDGGVYTDLAYPYPFWARYLEVFDQVLVLARVADEGATDGLVRADGPGVRFVAVRDFAGRRGLARGLISLTGAAARAVATANVAIIRVPGIIGTALHPLLRLTRKRYGVEVVGDPAESLTTAERGLHRFAAVARHQLTAQVGGADASLYVTRALLQRRYPPRPGTPTMAMSNVELPDALLAGPPLAIRETSTLRLVFVGVLAQPYKGLDVLLAALARTKLPHQLTVVGDGVLRPGLEADAAHLGLGDRVHFAGAQQKDDVFRTLAAADLFVLPSRTEGMPRVLLEAMAVGLPCVATAVGGVPELLPPEVLVPADDATALATNIDALANEPGRRRRLAAANRVTATAFGASAAHAVRTAFRRAVRAAAEPA